MKNELIESVKQAMKYWWMSLIVGVLAIILGILFIANPFTGLATLAILFTIGFIVSGLLEIIFAVSNRDTHNGWGWTLASGIIDLLLGILLISYPIVTIEVMIFFVGFYIMFQSIWAIGSSVELQRAGVKGWGWLLAMAILGIIFSFIFIMSPVFGGSVIVAFASIAFIIYGIFRIYLSFRYKAMKNHLDKID